MIQPSPPPDDRIPTKFELAIRILALITISALLLQIYDWLTCVKSS